jgi:RHS repeat-associated protein
MNYNIWKYDFTYDALTRLMKADFNQYTFGYFDKSAQVDYSMKMGDGMNANSAYDANGNIKRMQQWGLKIRSSEQIDDLDYAYFENSNRLKSVTEQGNGMIDHKLGDFTDKHTGTTDYGYDKNGNLITDLNKKIDGATGLDLSSGGAIQYNYLNLPAQITIKSDDGISVKGTITYTYDAAGNKHKKVTVDNTITPSKTNTTTYLGGMVYENDVLQFMAHEEGRIRPVRDENNAITDFVYDYFIKDHLGNVRMVLTSELKQNKYPVATLEDSKQSIELDYYAIDTKQIVSRSNASGIPDYINDNGIGNNPEDAAFSATNSAKLYKLNSNEAKTGLGITLKVMAGDKIDVLGKSYYFQNTTGTSGNSPLPILDLLVAFLSTPSSAVIEGHGALSPEILNTPSGVAGIASMFTQQTNQSNATPTKPRAFINVIFFDEQFKATDFKISMVDKNSTIKDHFSELQNLAATKSGYVYIYCSNESPVNVFFDNLQIVHTRGPILEETHYYPFGLTMQGISSRAMNFGNPENKRKWNKGSELENKEFSDGSGLELYSTFYRSLDPQLGRFWQTDPKPNYAQSLYSSMSNNPILYNDPLGDTARIQFRTGFLGLGGKKQVDYDGGKLTNTDGSAYTGKVKGFLKQAVKGLDRLSSGGPAGKDLVNTIVNSKETVNIIKGSSNRFTANDKATGMTNVVRWDPSNTTGGPDASLNQNRSAFIGFGHELAHAQDQITDGKIDYSTWYTTSGGVNIPKAEIYSTHVENMLRAENGINLRAFYSIGQNAAGAPIGEGPVLAPGTRTNANYPTINNPVFTIFGLFPLPYTY